VIKSVDPYWQSKSDWYHKSVPDHGVQGEEGKFTMCVPGEWDNSYTYNFLSLFRSGMCIKEVRTNIQNGDFTGCDVRVFNQFAFIWRNDWKVGNQTDRSEDNYFGPPAKLHPNVVDFYYAHESPHHYGYEIRGDTELSKKSLSNMQYLAWFNGDPDSSQKSSVWYPFGPSIGELLRDYSLFTIPREKRIPAVGWMSKDCVLRERINVLVEISHHFPVFSMGRCEQNIAPPPDDPGRLGDFAAQQASKAPYMFYYALENGISCPHYMTEKIWDALSRGSIPIYIGWDGFEDYIPDKNAVIDLRDYPTAADLAAKLTLISVNDDEYNKAHAWRYRSPDQWPIKFRNLIRQVSADLKYPICATLKEGPDNHPPAQATETCDKSVQIMGTPVNQYPGRKAQWWEEGGWKFETAHRVDPTATLEVEITSPLKFLKQTCEAHTVDCFHSLNTATSAEAEMGALKTNKLNSNRNINNKNYHDGPQQQPSKVSSSKASSRHGNKDVVFESSASAAEEPIKIKQHGKKSGAAISSHSKEHHHSTIMSEDAAELGKTKKKESVMEMFEDVVEDVEEVFDNGAVEESSAPKASKKSKKTEEVKEEVIRKETAEEKTARKTEQKLEAKIAKKKALELERVRETVADLPIIKEPKQVAPPPPGEAKHDVTKTTNDFDADIPSADKEEFEALKERLQKLDEVSVEMKKQRSRAKSSAAAAAADVQ
jgi:hypothetical protein